MFICRLLRNTTGYCFVQKHIGLEYNLFDITKMIQSNDQTLNAFIPFNLNEIKIYPSEIQSIIILKYINSLFVVSKTGTVASIDSSKDEQLFIYKICNSSRILKTKKIEKITEEYIYNYDHNYLIFTHNTDNGKSKKYCLQGKSMLHKVGALLFLIDQLSMHWITQSLEDFNAEVAMITKSMINTKALILNKRFYHIITYLYLFSIELNSIKDCRDQSLNAHSTHLSEAYNYLSLTHKFDNSIKDATVEVKNVQYLINFYIEEYRADEVHFLESVMIFLIFCCLVSAFKYH